jgi:hypothetical protein
MTSGAAQENRYRSVAETSQRDLQECFASSGGGMNSFSEF